MFRNQFEQKVKTILKRIDFQVSVATWLAASPAFTKAFTQIPGKSESRLPPQNSNRRTRVAPSPASTSLPSKRRSLWRSSDRRNDTSPWATCRWREKRRVRPVSVTPKWRWLVFHFEYTRLNIDSRYGTWKFR